MVTEVERVIEYSARSVRSVGLAVPDRNELLQELADAEEAEKRGYFLPDEDERVRAVFARYLSVRVALLEAVDAMNPLYDVLGGGDDDNEGEGWEQCLRAFVVGFAAAAILVRMGTYMVDLAADRPVVWKKLDEPESRFGIPEKSFTMVYKNLGSTRRMWRFHEALMFSEVNREDIEALEHDPVVGELVSLLRAEEPFLQYSKSDYLKRKLDYHVHSFKRKHVSGYKKVMFHMLKLSGSAIAELKQPFVKAPGQGKRVTPEVMATVRPLLRAGDVLVTRHDDAMSNLFLPGFWPHAALYIGSVEERDRLGVSRDVKEGCGRDGICFLEAKKDGVLFRPMSDTMQVDAFMVLRPQLESAEVAEALARAMSHEGKLYDFSFDFCMADRLACTELIYRGYHRVGAVSFELNRHSGRSCISAEDLIDQALRSGAFKKVLDYGVEEDLVRLL
jgi:hypothetical protein